MVFWGVEVKPGKPITHSCEKARGRLRISQATLGFGDSFKSSVVQCNVGSRSPVLICVLLPSKMESSHIELEFEEADDVVFSVVGRRSVYLTGYYVRENRHSNSRSDTDSYGVDIEHSPTDRSNYNCDDDGYEDSFINDDELQVSSPGSPVFHSKGMDEVTPEKDERKNKKGRSKLCRKKKWVIESDNDASSPEKEDEAGEMDGEGKRDVKTTTCDAREMDDEAKDDIRDSETKQKVDPPDISDRNERVTHPSLDEERTEVDKMQSLDLEKPNKKRKECPLTERTSEIQTDNEDPSVPREHKEHEAEASADLIGVGGDHLMTGLELDSANGQKSKKRRNEPLEGELTEDTDEKLQIITDKQGSLHTDSMPEHMPAANEECEQQKPEETNMEKCGVDYHNVQSQSDDEIMQEVHADQKIDDLPAEVMQEVHANRKTDYLLAEVMQGVHADRKTDDLPAEVMQEVHVERNADDLTAANGDDKKGLIDSNICTNSELLANDNQSHNITKKKKKTRGKIDLSMSKFERSDNQETENESYSTHVVPTDTRTLSNGLIIKELGSGPPGGKVAVLGKKIKIFYNGMLKESGHVYDSNVGKPAFKFQLGDEEYIDGWNVGIEGMRVGDKRRLIIPPSMGYGDVAVGENIPPNSWLIYDIELVRVYH